MPSTSSPTSTRGQCRFVWLGTHKLFDAFTFAFEQTEHGWFQAHAYRFDDETSTFIVETPEDVWRKAGLDTMEKEEAIAFCERLFAEYLDGHALMSNATPPARLGAVDQVPARGLRARWVHHNGRAPVVLMGDAAHTAHFSIGSGTKLAIEDAIELARCIGAGTRRPARRACSATRRVRSVEVLRIQNAARNSTEWFENVDRYVEPAARAVRLFAADAQPAHQPREPAPARQGLRGAVRGLVRRAGRLRRAARQRGRCRRCSRRSRCAA